MPESTNASGWVVVDTACPAPYAVIVDADGKPFRSREEAELVARKLDETQYEGAEYDFAVFLAPAHRWTN